MKALLDAGADHSARDMFGRTPLPHVALGHRIEDVARAGKPLIYAGADSATLDDNGDIALLSLATRRRDSVAIRALVAAGANRKGAFLRRVRLCAMDWAQ